MTHAINPSWYAARLPDTTEREPFYGEADADVVVVGGGLTGVSTALYLAEQGWHPRLLEAGRIGGEASGRNGGQALQGLAASMATVEDAVGLDAARAIWTMSREALALLKDNIRRFNIACDLTERGYVYTALHTGQLRDLADWQQQAAAHYDYHDLQLIDRDALPQYINSTRYVGALFDPNEVHLDPLAYTLALARAAEAAGATLHERTRVTGWQAKGDGYRVSTPNGSIRCGHIVLAVNAGAAKLVPELARAFLPVESFIVATEPLGEAAADTLIPCRAAVGDSNRVLNYFRLSADHRLLFGGRASGTTSDRAADTRQRMLSVFPQLADVAITHSWGGIVDVTPHKLPHFGRLADGTYFAQGFSGHGLALTGLAGKLIAEAITGNPARFDQFAALPQYRLPTQLPGFNAAVVTAGMAWYQLRDWVDQCWNRD
jgi:gamma-glutamylputrescine oxidase